MRLALHRVAGLQLDQLGLKRAVFREVLLLLGPVEPHHQIADDQLLVHGQVLSAGGDDGIM